MPRPARTTVVQFSVPHGIYSVIPLLGKIPDATSRYCLRLYFNCEEDQISLHNDQQHVTIQRYAARSMDQTMKSFGGWTGLYTADDGATKSIGTNPFAKIVMTPYQLNSIVNKSEKTLQKSESNLTFGKLSTMAQNKRALEQTAPYYEDNALSATSSFKLVTPEESQTREQTRIEAIRGFDPEAKHGNPDFEAKLPPKELMQVEKVRAEVTKEIETIVDLAYFNLTNDAFAQLLPVLEVKYFSDMTLLDLRGNSIDDTGIL